MWPVCNVETFVALACSFLPYLALFSCSASRHHLTACAAPVSSVMLVKKPETLQDLRIFGLDPEVRLTRCRYVRLFSSIIAKLGETDIRQNCFRGCCKHCTAQKVQERGQEVVGSYAVSQSTICSYCFLLSQNIPSSFVPTLSNSYIRFVNSPPTILRLEVVDFRTRTPMLRLEFLDFPPPIPTPLELN